MSLSSRSTPAMGWNSWNAFRAYQIDEDTILGNADALIRLGLADAGYTTVVVDDGWQAPLRDSTGRLQACPRRFPHGMKWLARQIHARGLKFGLYLAPGRNTCAQIWDAYGHTNNEGAAVRPSLLKYARARLGKLPPVQSDPKRLNNLGSWQREAVDLAQLTEFGVDYLKYDWCKAECGTGLCPQEAFTKMGALIATYPQEITYSISEYGKNQPWEWAGQIANSWRTTPDIAPTARSIFAIARRTAAHYAATRAGAVNDPDMLQVGNTHNRCLDQSHLLLWGMLGAPLMIGTDLSRIRDGADSKLVSQLTDEVALWLNQHHDVSSAQLVSSGHGLDTYQRQLGDDEVTLIVNTWPIAQSARIAQPPPRQRRVRIRVGNKDVKLEKGSVFLRRYESALILDRKKARN